MTHPVWDNPDCIAALEREWSEGRHSKWIASVLREMSGYYVSKKSVLAKAANMGLPRRDGKNRTVADTIRSIKPDVCRHYSCERKRVGKTQYCAEHAPSAARTPVAISSITKEMLMAGNGRIARRRA